KTELSKFDLGDSQTPMYNGEAAVTAMCYTKHESTYNPCYVCHQNRIHDGRANTMDDGFLQNEYLFSEVASTNNWTNVFKDRSAQVAKISDEEIEKYVNSENYTHLAPLLQSKEFIGYIPDLNDYHLGAEAFNSDGFAKDGSGWVAFNYKPLPSTFWPVNGSTDDVLIRLHKDYRQTHEGNFSATVYKFNLAIVEMAIKDQNSTTVDNLDERIIGTDLNGDGKLTNVTRINRPQYYVGKASYMPVESFLYPRYTEFLHSVRYIGATDNGTIYNAPRMKELRYMIKEKSYADEHAPFDKKVLAIIYDDEWQEKWEGNNPPYFPSLQEKGMDNKMGWWIQGFIEDANGSLRPQTYEESFFCMGCHTNVGTTIDQVFSFARKVDGKEGWKYIDLKSMMDVPNVGEQEGEILTYLKRAGGGSEFRAKNDIYTKFYDNGVLNETKVKNATSIYELITPTRESALKMSKAYKVLVESQDFIHGREGNGEPLENVYDKIDDTTPTFDVDKHYQWDIRLDWSKSSK
ncbi:MAG: hypothetical protein JXQ76_10380, partial [Campylobacterales bacterium]|nr:hypothetical protein [Campylobacterales bacterium]